MRISETGPASRRARRSISGFTLIEIMVVVLIIGVMAAGVVLSLNFGGRDSQLQQESDRVLTITGYLREQAALQNRQYGMRCFDGGYEFLVYDPRRDVWERVDDDPLLRMRRLPAGLLMDLVVEGRPLRLPRFDDEQLLPQVLLFSSGDVGDFRMTLSREGSAVGNDVSGERIQLLPDEATGDIIARSPAAT